MDEMANVLVNNGLGVASFLALIIVGKYILEDIKKSLDNNVKVLNDVTLTLQLMNKNLIELTNRVDKLEKVGEE